MHKPKAPLPTQWCMVCDGSDPRCPSCRGRSRPATWDELHKWHLWYAWHPIRMWGKWVWLQHVARAYRYHESVAPYQVMVSRACGLPLLRRWKYDHPVRAVIGD
jgi:hypothetical protein